MPSNNNTTSLSPGPTNGKWAIFLSIEFALIVVELYLFVALTYFFLKNLATKRRNHKSGNVLLFLVVFVLLIGAIKCSVVVYAFLAPIGQTAEYCDVIERTYQGITCVGVILLYTFLWARQYSLYKEPQLQMLVSPWVVTFSKYLLIPMVILWAAGLVALIIFGSADHHVYLLGTNTCTFKTEIDLNAIALFVCMGLVSIFNVCILFLFVYILRKHEKELLLYDITSSPDRRSMQCVIRNCVVAAFVTIVTDLVTVILDYVLPVPISQPVFLFLWDVSFAVNVSCLLVCFMNWKKMIFPWSLKKIPLPSRLP